MDWYMCIFLVLGLVGQILGECAFEKHKTTPKEKEILRSLEGKRYKAEDAISAENGGFSYRVGICASAATEDEYNDNSGNGIPYKHAGVLQTAKRNPDSSDTDSSNQTPHVVGRIDQTEVMSGTDWILLEYEGGDRYGSHCGSENRRANIMIICKPGEYQGVMRVIGENNNKTGDCFYLFELDHDAACTYKSGGGVSVGTVLLLVFFCIVALYLIGGFIYQRFVVGAKGWEQIPNYGFWQDFGNLQADGCNFICRSGGHNRQAKSYRGIGDDQLQTEEEEERDDHLLPM